MLKESAMDKQKEFRALQESVFSWGTPESVIFWKFDVIMQGHQSFNTE